MIAHCCGAEIWYEITGNGSRKVVLLHGWGCSTDMMKATASALAGEMTVLSVDFPGHGKSGRPPEPWGVPEYAEALKALLLQLDFIPCSAIAHSFGGRIAIWLASGEPGLFERLILTGAAGLKKPQTEEAKARTERYQKLKKRYEKLAKIPGLSGAAAHFAEKLRKKYGSADYNALDEEMRKTFVRVISLDLADRLPLIQQPTLLLWGDKDTETPLWMGQKMERDIPDAGLVVLEGGSHFAYLEQAARFNLIAKQFLLGE